MNLFFDEDTSNIIYIDNDYIKLVCFTPESGLNSIRSVQVKDLSGLDENASAEALYTAWQESGAEGRTAHVVVTSKYAITKTIEVPSFDKNEIASIVKLQASQHTPYSKNEIIYDYVTLDQIEGRHTRTLLTIFSQSNVQKHLNIVREAGIEVKSVRADFDCVAAGLNKSLMVNPTDVTAIVMIDSSKTDFIVVTSGLPYFVRNINIGAKHAADDAKFQSMISEIEKSKEAFTSSEPDKRISRIITMGPATSVLEKVARNVTEKLGMNVQIAHAADHVEVSPEVSQYIAGNSLVTFDHVLLAAAGSGSFLLDMTPNDIKDQHEFRKKARKIMRSGVTVFSAFVLFLVAMFSKIYFAHAYLNAVETGFNNNNVEATSLTVIAEQNANIQKFAQSKGMVVRAISKLESILPDEMILNELNVSSDGNVVIKGTASSMSRVFGFETEYENASGFTSVNTDYAKSRKVDGQDITDFGISAVFESEN